MLYYVGITDRCQVATTPSTVQSTYRVAERATTTVTPCPFGSCMEYQMSDSDLNIALIVKELKSESTDCLSIVYKKPRGFSFEPGMWMDVRFLSEELSIGRTFSFSSSPTEPDLMITFKKGTTKFKQSMESVEPGDVMLITQYGSNGLRLDRKYNSVFIAGGVGIAPFRSMIKEGIDYNEDLSIKLIYVNHADDFPFKRELNEWQQTDRSLSVHYIMSGEEGRLTREKLRRYLDRSDITEAKFYVAGPPGMVSSCESTLWSLQV